MQNSHFNHFMKRYCEWRAAYSEFCDCLAWFEMTPFLFRCSDECETARNLRGWKGFISPDERKNIF